MNLAVKFMHSLAQALSTIGLYSEEHPARVSALEKLDESLAELLDENERPSFTFFKGEVIYIDSPLRELKGWALSARLSESSIERIEFTLGVSIEELGAFIVDLNLYLIDKKEIDDGSIDVFPHIRYGSVSLLEGSGGGSDQFDLYEQAEMAGGLFTEAKKNGRIPAVLSRSVLDSIWGAMHSEDEFIIPIVPTEEGKDLAPVRAMNTAVLAVAFGRFMDLKASEIRMLAEAALLHDIGKVAIPDAILNKPGKLEPGDWEYIRKHPIAGAKILLRSGERFEMAAVAACEHHLELDGSGYPELIYPRTPHRVSQVVRLCDVYDAMRTKRPYEPEQPLGKIMEVMRSGAGRKFSPDLVEHFTSMLRKWDAKFVHGVTGGAGEDTGPDTESIGLI
ncbi:HD-GYP domain-containing protein [Gemmatimonadota bacterium]